MDFDLLSQNLLLVLCTILTAIAVYWVTQFFLKDKKINKKDTRRLYSTREKLEIFAGAIVSSLVLAELILLLFAHLSDSQLPGSILFMTLPFTTALALLTMSLVLKKKKELWILASGAVFLGAVFSLLLVNNYYRFYPTIGELFNENNNVLNAGKYQNGIFSNFTHTVAKNNTRDIQYELSSIDGQSTKGQVYSLNIPGTVSKFNARTAYVYLPASYQKLNSINFPVIVLSAGFPGLPANWIWSGLQTTMDEFAQTHEGITPLVFMVDNTGSLTNDTECVNSPRGNVETYLTTDVPNYIKSHFRVIDSPNNWAIGGLSMGGTCSVMLALIHPNVYHYFMDYGGEAGPEVGSEQTTIDELFGGSESAWAAHQPSILLATKKYKGLGIGGFFGYGNQDTRTVVDDTNELIADSQKAGIETVSETISGPHTFQVWQQLYKDSLPWVSNRIGATQCLSQCL